MVKSDWDYYVRLNISDTGATPKALQEKSLTAIHSGLTTDRLISDILSETPGGQPDTTSVIFRTDIPPSQLSGALKRPFGNAANSTLNYKPEGTKIGGRFYPIAAEVTLTFQPLS